MPIEDVSLRFQFLLQIRTVHLDMLYALPFLDLLWCSCSAPLPERQTVDIDFLLFCFLQIADILLVLFAVFIVAISFGSLLGFLFVVKH